MVESQQWLSFPWTKFSEGFATVWIDALGGGGEFFSRMELIQTRQRNCLMFSTWPIAPAPRCSKFLLVFGKVIIIIITVFFWGGGVPSSTVQPPRHTAHDATWVERWAGTFRSSRGCGGGVPYTCSWNQTLSSPSILCHIKWASWCHQYKFRSLTQKDENNLIDFLFVLIVLLYYFNGT